MSIPRPHLLQLGLVLSIVAGSGASCPRAFQRNTSPTPVVFAAPPSVDQVRDYLQVQSGRVRSLQITGGRLAIAGAPSLSSSLALERPRRLRMQANLGFTGAEVDLGSNDEEFWFWAKRNDPPGVYFARHVDAATPGVVAVLPVPPTWLIEALGLVELDPQAQFQGPFQRPPNQFELRAVSNTPTGTLTKVLMIEATYGHVLEQTVYDAAGRLIAVARGSQHEYIPSAGVALPHIIDIQLPTMAMEFRLEIDGYLVNQLVSDPNQLWRRPEFPGYPSVNLASGLMQAATADRRWIEPLR